MSRHARGFTVYQMPTLANPEAIDSVVELRQHLHRINNELIAACMREQEIDRKGNEMMQTLFTVLLMHLKSVSELTGYLDAYLNDRPNLRETLEDALEAAGNTRTH